MQTSVYNLQGRSVSKINLGKQAFGLKDNPQLLAQAVRVYLSNQRKARAKAKTRAEVSGSRRKIWRQKGTGRARHGDRYAPIFVGGGVAHGPTGKENYQKRLPKKMKTKALAVALSAKAKNREIKVITGLDKIKGKTKEMAKLMETIIKKEKLKKREPKLLLVLAEKKEKVIRAGNNLANLEITLASQLHPYQILNNDLLLLTKEAVKQLEARSEGKTEKEKES